MESIRNINNLLLSVLFIILFLFCTGCKDDITEPDLHYTEPVTTDDGWETGTLSSVSMDKSFFEELTLKISIGNFGEVHSVIVVKNNKLVFERYWPGHDFKYSDPNFHGQYINFGINTRHNTHSTTKSFTSALVGIAIDKGFINSKDDKIFDYLPESYDNLNSQGREKLTIAHCLKMASGLKWNEWDVDIKSADHDIIRFNNSSDPINFLLSKPVVTEPGTAFYYNGGTVDLLGELIRYAVNRSVQSFSANYLFGALGITNYNWTVLYPSGITCCHGDIYITPRDMAKFGQLFLDDGVWKGERIISSEWVNLSTQNHINPNVSWADGYGYLWWIRNFRVNGVEYNSFKTSGWGGQEIFIFKELEMVVVFTGANYTEDTHTDFIVSNYILPALR